jgi:uncharacterized linocin/CFP29 family protein
MATMDLVPPPLEAAPQANGLPGAPAPAGNLGREKLADWTPALWEHIDAEVHAELKRACIATKLLPVVSASPSERTVPADAIAAGAVLSIDQSQVLALLEESQPFLLTKEQYQDEAKIGTATTLATRAANVLARRIDTAVFDGNVNPNLLDAAERQFVVKVPELENNPGQYGENTFRAVAEAYARLQGAGHYGPYALVLRTEPYADAHAPLPTTLIMPADRIKPLMTAGFFGTGTVPEKRGVMVSIGGNTVDVAIGVAGATAFAQVDDDENYRFRVYSRSTVRIKDPTALILLEFA